ncbi:hypothetical protein JCGZ_20685 [Jatropha curcas]|uniref:Uncharacterized protein n=1 Tax=Jatropha curcas TaxID=180498 RepID=A0A067K153_JATCU|nr:cucumisin [Jatropha curcas]KDP25529.1 hypothetical protein JCGZ_20685 [Jatropha curcas]
MAMAGLLALICSLLLAALFMDCHADERKVYIVYMGEGPPGDFPPESVHNSMLESVLPSNLSAKESIIYSYGRSFNGFAAKLTDEEARTISEMEGVISVILNPILKLHTTRSWEFMGFTNAKIGPSQEADVVVGLLDTGIWPESESFNDEGMKAPPAKWKGKCIGANFTCNKKIIGARWYNGLELYDISEIKSPRDTLGHGTHTSSTAAGREVQGASYSGLAEGLARGGVPNARIAVYKVCWSFGCYGADILAAFDDAIADGVDILSLSLGSVASSPYFEDPVAIGSYHAMKNGILTSNSAGNSGPEPFSVSNVAPWTLTVAASTIDRKFVAKVVLGNGQVLNGLSINDFDLNGTSYPLIWGGDAANYSGGVNSDLAKYCPLPGTMNSYKVAGKIVFCERWTDGAAILVANGIGTIMMDGDDFNVAFNYPLPATTVSEEEGVEILNYIKSTREPTATILVGETWKDTTAPSVASFSSRGPNQLCPDILKPDITSPGVDILAAWSPLAAPSLYEKDSRSKKFNVISGTSMSCPHASGAAAYVKAAHPDWSPAAIKSALMTTAYIMDPSKHEEVLEFGYGSGHINPLQAVDPGLAYDASEADYINFLCKQGYNTTTLRLITGDNSTVCKTSKLGRAWDLNYPTFAVAVEDRQPIQGVFTRTVTNVGSPNSTYTVSVYMPHPVVKVAVKPSTLSFSAVGEKKTFTVTVHGPKIAQTMIVSGAISWKDGVHVVRSPVVVYNILPGYTYGVPSSESEKTYRFQVPIYRKNGMFSRQ